MKAVHLICRRDGISLLGLSRVPGEHSTYRSCCWAFHSSEKPEELVGGWAYLHPIAKSSPSEFGGVVRAVEPAKREGKPIEDGYVLTIESRPEGKGQRWRGADHIMAWTSGIIEAGLPHERS